MDKTQSDSPLSSQEIYRLGVNNLNNLFLHQTRRVSWLASFFRLAREDPPKKSCNVEVCFLGHSFPRHGASGNRASVLRAKARYYWVQKCCLVQLYSE